MQKCRTGNRIVKNLKNCHPKNKEKKINFPDAKPILQFDIFLFMIYFLYLILCSYCLMHQTTESKEGRRDCVLV